jgi:DNA repair photolyase
MVFGNFGANLYGGCEHGCVYCDGRAERYFVDGDFDRDIAVKVNALEIARQELKQRREPGFIFLGGGVSDCYQPAEAQYRLACGLLQLTLEAGLGVHVLTKSALVERDFDLLSEINRQSKTIVSFSLHTVDDNVRRDFEPKTASVKERFRLLEYSFGRSSRNLILDSKKDRSLKYRT